MSFVRLAHLSDPHLPMPVGAYGWRDVLSKRTLSRIAWRRKHQEHDPAVLAALVADIHAQAPDHIAITGDLTNFASPVEIEQATAWLASVGSPSDVTLSPGNHDALVGVSDSSRFSAWAPWLGDDGGTTFPHVRRRGGMALINLCSAVPTALHSAGGWLGRDQLERLDALLAEHADAFRVLMLHHPPVTGAVTWRKKLADQEDLRAVLVRRGAELVLHGHAHRALVAAIPGHEGAAVPVLGVPSASARGGRGPAARWHMLEIAPDKSMQVIARGLEGGDMVELGRYRLDPPSI